MAGIVVSEDQFSFFILVLVSVIDFFNSIFCIDKLFDIQNRTIHQNNRRFYNSLFRSSYLLLNIYGFSKSIIVDFSYSGVKGPQIGLKRHIEYFLMHPIVHAIAWKDDTHQPIRHIPDLSRPNLQRTIH